MLISQGNLPQSALEGEVAIVTGAGRGTGFEAARALLWLGAKVVVAEVNEKTWKAAAESLKKSSDKKKHSSSRLTLETKKTSKTSQ